MAHVRVFVLALGVTALLLASYQGAAAAEWSFEVMGGTAVHAPITMTVTQEGYDPFAIKPEWGTHPFEEAPYYSWRIGRWTGDKGWELELIHDKMILENPDGSVISHFQVSHGYNYVLINHARRVEGLTYRLGAGFILSHPESNVRGKSFGDYDFLQGFYISGPGVQASAQYTVLSAGPFSLNAEIKATAAWARVLVADGYADVPALAVHGLVGVGYIW